MLEFLSAERKVSNIRLKSWSNIFPPVVNMPVPGSNPSVDPVPGIFQRIADMAAESVVPSNSPQTCSSASEEVPSDSEDSDAASDGSSGWESEESVETGMEVEGTMHVEVVSPNVDTGGSYFATS